MEYILTFLGTSEDEVTSKDFMKVYWHATINNSNLNTDEAKISNLQNYLGSDSPVEEWYEVTGKALNKWPDFELLDLDYVICHMVSRLTNLVMSRSQGLT
jgi:hypothetical protein